jgi:SAM-dependent methyltransferase
LRRQLWWSIGEAVQAMGSAASDEMAKLYGTPFHSDRHQRTLHAAQTVLGSILDSLPVDSVIDVGCGVGTWLEAAKKLGVSDVVGVEGNWIEKDLLQIDQDEMIIHNLLEPYEHRRRYDLAISLEVAEHLPEARAASFVEELCRASDRVLFSAAVPGQGGVGHANEQWQSYWATRFSEWDYQPLDYIRPRIWSDPNIDWWYKQNILLYVSKPKYEETCMALESRTNFGASQIDLVHPELYLRYQQGVESFWFLYGRIKIVLRKKLKVSS